MIEAVVFDWGGTLSTYVHVDPATVWQHAARRLSPDGAEALCAALTEAEAALWATVAGEARSSTVRRLIEYAAAAHGLAPSPEAVEEAARGYLGAWAGHVVHRDDARHVLETLRERGIRTGLLSNTFWPGPFHDDLLARDGLRDLIDVRHYTSERERMKPHPEVFAHVLADLGVGDPGNAVFVGDRLYDDVHGARRAGLRTVRIANPHVPAYDVEPDATIDDLAELLPLVDAWSPGRNQAGRART